MAVVGAGPAGARAAELLAAGGFEVLLFDPRAPWEKPCGGGIPAHALAHFPELRGLADQGRQVRRVRLIAPGGAAVEIELPEPLFLVDRARLARYQLDRARAAGAWHLPHRIRDIARRAEGFCLVDEDGREYDVACVIGADGASSRVRRLLAPAFAPRQTPTRGRFLPVDGPDPAEILVRFPPGLHGYVWEFPRGETWSVGICHLVEGELARGELEAFLDGHLGDRDGSPGRREYGHPIPLLRAEDHEHPERFGGADWALCGDAAGLVDPITGEGIHYALYSGELAARTLLRDGSLAAYPAGLAREVLSELRLADRYAGRFYQPGFTDALVDVCRRSPAFRRVVADVMTGRLSYRSLRRRALMALGRDALRGRVGGVMFRVLRGLAAPVRTGYLPEGKGATPCSPTLEMKGDEPWLTRRRHR